MHIDMNKYVSTVWNMITLARASYKNQKNKYRKKSNENIEEYLTKIVIHSIIIILLKPSQGTRNRVL